LALEKDRESLLKIMLHGCDISNTCKPWNTSKEWSDRVLEEFFAQGDREQALGLSVSPNCDKATTRQAEVSLNFLDFIVGPYMVGLVGLLPKFTHPCIIMGEYQKLVLQDTFISRIRLYAVFF
jgi:hypothetical protein